MTGSGSWMHVLQMTLERERELFFVTAARFPRAYAAEMFRADAERSVRERVDVAGRSRREHCVVGTDGIRIAVPRRCVRHLDLHRAAERPRRARSDADVLTRLQRGGPPGPV